MDENIKDILDQDTWLPVTPDITKDGYIKIDLNKVDLVTYSFNKRFRQGENGPQLKLWFYDGNQPHQLDKDNSSVTLYGLDAGDKIKVISADQSDTWQTGRVVIALSSQVMATAGQYKRCVIEVKNKDQVIATINFNLDVLPNDFYNLNIGSDPFSSQVDEKVKNTINYFNDISKEATDKYDGLKQAIDNITDQIAKNNIVTKDQLLNYYTRDEIDAMLKKLNGDGEVTNKQSLPSGSFVGIPSTVTAYLGNGTVSRTLDSGETFGTDTSAILNNKTVYRVSTDEWVYSNEVTYVTPKIITVTPSSTSPRLYNSCGKDVSRSLTVVPYPADMVMTYGDITAYRISTNEYIDSRDTTTGNSGGNTGTTVITGINATSSNLEKVGVIRDSKVISKSGVSGRTISAGQDFQASHYGTYNGEDYYQISTDEWIKAYDVTKVIKGNYNDVTISASNPRLYNDCLQNVSRSISGTFHVDASISGIDNNGNTIDGLRISTNEYVDQRDTV
ncbi:MAG: BppU family phage baseplate upper protein [Companilactobacillus sp.]|jgi:hypothetical protein|uniref:BppU family phage baseplate upper protein n=1 Tax=Companilactobacillus sp. TaxID=2767905 RepID=UPI0025BD047C|nr:BppU family phage baseplate upper protein [Companilactobacillus sp.]MCH4010380.1 BppU family phage baseplate upper protein [Companilactobacillus sp.]MCH4051944.1 BppU family phage baseplate upper protein [Companilactobacillus sp.]MCH4075820.1 BppU family phage baseplate upper protein [Companilactobacillus sp.]MCH4126898.1 BppU family phage baseplate upper protein [Companilactobacillus sp.]